ncbi:glycoside hydrolase family 24 [filamentous cyanobacterium CCP2]|nr:glycoside hydrolase family 24 [filamentous cyanobacterium CCP2]
MQGGDPYIRALMRTISASESNSPRPYSILYGGQHVYDLSRHPDLCITIVAGPNTGDCTTAAGRYQMLTTTWYSKAEEYHPRSPFLFFGQDYSFEAQYQDEVVYHWLNDPSAWGIDLSQLLRDGQINEVLQILSPTWTSLGYGIETNSMSSFLPEIYQEMLQEELRGG